MSNDLPTYDVHMGFRLVQVLESGAIMEAKVGPHLANPTGMIHGGTLAGLCDSTMGQSAVGLAPKGKIPTNVDLHVRFLRAPIPGPVLATSSVVRSGRTGAVLACEVTQEGKVIATATSQFVWIGAR